MRWKQGMQFENFAEKIKFLTEHKNDYTIIIDHDEVSAIPKKEGLERIYIGNTPTDILFDWFISLGFDDVTEG